ncbi:MAG TPA: zinc ribbon domain-containing protein [Steroidobacteraceae bacterium]|nr:zinc ribbon domain-containing protein [Steroidobacteraceae bacterium]
MPFYEYECTACKYYTEVLQKISDKPLRKCPSCGKGGFKRLVSAPVFRLKGSGWYETDFKSEKEKQRNLAGAERDEAAPAEAGAKSDDKAAAKPGAEAGSAKTEPATKAGKAVPVATGGAAGKSSRGKARPAVKSAARRGAKRPARAAARGRGRR